jgi:hypothetical protein
MPCFWTEPVACTVCPGGAGDEFLHIYRDGDSFPLFWPADEPPSVTGDESNVNPTFVGVYDQVISRSGSQWFTAQRLFFQRRLVTRGDYTTGLPYVSSVANGSLIMPTVSWVPETPNDPSPVLTFVGNDGVWELWPDENNSEVYYTNGVFTIGGPGPGVRTVVTIAPDDTYSEVTVEYVWVP